MLDQIMERLSSSGKEEEGLPEEGVLTVKTYPSNSGETITILRFRVDSSEDPRFNDLLSLFREELSFCEILKVRNSSIDTKWRAVNDSGQLGKGKGVLGTFEVDHHHAQEQEIEGLMRQFLVQLGETSLWGWYEEVQQLQGMDPGESSRLGNIVERVVVENRKAATRMQ